MSDQLLGGVAPPLEQIRLAEPDERRDIVGSQMTRFLERGCRLGQRPLRLVELPQKVRPAYVGRSERLRVEIAGLRGVEVRRGHEQLAQLAKIGRASCREREEERE